MLNVLRGFDRARAIPTTMFTKIQDNKLSLINENLTKTETDILGKFIRWTKEHREYMILFLEIKNCRFTEQQLCSILTGVA